MKRSGFVLINLIILGIGILFIALSRRQEPWGSLIYFTGLVFMIPGIVNIFQLLISGSRHKKAEEEGKKTEQPSVWSRFVSWTVSVAAIVLGIMMCFRPDIFHTPVIYILAISGLIGGLYHLYMLLRGLRPVTFAIWTYIFPAAIIGISAALIFIPSLRDAQNQATPTLLIGITMIIFALTSFFESIAVRSFNRKCASNPSLPSSSTSSDSNSNPDSTSNSN